MLPAGPARQCEMQAFLTMSARVNNAARDARNMWPFSVVQMEELMRKVQREKLVVQSIKLSGHADRLNSTGQNDDNQRLSEKRVAAVQGQAEPAGHRAGADEQRGQWKHAADPGLRAALQGANGDAGMPAAQPLGGGGDRSPTAQRPLAAAAPLGGPLSRCRFPAADAALRRATSAAARRCRARRRAGPRCPSPGHCGGPREWPRAHCAPARSAAGRGHR